MQENIHYSGLWKNGLILAKDKKTVGLQQVPKCPQLAKQLSVVRVSQISGIGRP